eukprot:CAMPEP_0180137406 /NCGR_PEP_ID=MMETSP0986-20121125/12188_1 /TAXON_ID=697907 /ORGANISM="non described non described, Strain CCMP2293" /LENGTH=36 /DNA_ID= /DNA_START= /DNA_END= /DNA_ORIENTATION=
MATMPPPQGGYVSAGLSEMPHNCFTQRALVPRSILT